MTGKPITIEMKVSDQPTLEVELHWVRPPRQEYLGEIIITGKCAICHGFLHNDFPEDFPKDWKFCCQCKIIAESLVNDCSVGDYRAFKDSAQKIWDRITLVG